MKNIKTPKEQIRTENASLQVVAKRNDSIQKARFSLSLQETKCVSYAVSLIKPTDTAQTEYTMDLKLLYDLCGIEKDSYTALKKILQKLADKSWWLITDDKGTESNIRWFDTLDITPRSGKVRFTFHRRMMPFLLQLAEQYRENGLLYTQYPLKNVLPMRSQYGIRLYELLCSYSNNPSWFFDTDGLKHLLDCENYNRWPDFKRYVLEPAIKDINEYTDLVVNYDTEKDGRRIAQVSFNITRKA